MFKALLKTRLKSMYAGMFRSSRKKKQQGLGMKILIGILTVYLVAVFGGLFAMMFMALCAGLAPAGLSWLYFSVAGIIAVVLSFVGSVMAAQSQLFEAKDNEMLLAMPIPPTVILGSRMVALYLITFAFQLLVLLPAGIVYAVMQPVSVAGVLIFVLTMFLLPFLSLFFSCLFGWVIAWISSKMRHKNIIVLVLSMAFFVLYFWGYSQIQTYIDYLVQQGQAVADAIRRAVFPAYHLGIAIAEQNPLSLLFFALCALVPFALVYYLLSISFVRIATSRKGAGKRKYKARTLKTSSVRAALVKKELRHVWSNPMYMLNGAMGSIMMILLAGALIFMQGDIREMIRQLPAEFTAFVSPVLCAAICFCVSINILSAPSISLEGKSLWILQSSPVSGGDVLVSKAMAHMAVGIPPLLAAGIIGNILFPSTLPMALLVIALPLAFTVLTALWGVFINLHFPKFDWISETAAIKQSASTMIAMFSGMGFVMVPVLLYPFALSFIPLSLYLLIWTVLFAGLSAWLYRYLATKGAVLFARL